MYGFLADYVFESERSRVSWIAVRGGYKATQNPTVDTRSQILEC